MKIYKIAIDDKPKNPSDDLWDVLLKTRIERYCPKCGVNPVMYKDPYGFKRCRNCRSKIDIRKVE